MDDKNKPISREKNVTSGGGNVSKRGSGLGTGPVGNTNGYAGRKSDSGTADRQTKATKGKSKGLSIGAVIVILLVFGAKSLFGGSGSSDDGEVPDLSTGTTVTASAEVQTGSAPTLSTQTSYETTEQEYAAAQAANSTASYSAVAGAADATVVSGARDKRTQILGNGQDVVTIMLYMCGTDLESKHGMATSDLTEMCNATIGRNVNLIVYTGGCKTWKNSNVSSLVNQIFEIRDGKMTCIENDMGSDPMTKPATLTSFIKYCAKYYPANRQFLIFWDHGGGSLSGFGYDEKNSGSGSMSLAGINTALKDAGEKFDIIGFDACLMATVENALMLEDYADYMVASEETEPGVGWYYTNWLSRLSADTSMSSVAIGKNIIDDFVEVCNQKTPKSNTTLSIVDLAEVASTVPGSLNSFAKATNKLIQEEDYKIVSDARYATREFAASSKIDQIDLVDFARKIGTEESSKLAESLLGAIKYNRTSSGYSNAYGLSIYFPYKKASKVDTAVNTYDAIGMDPEYSACIKEFASLEVSGQVSQGGSNSVLSTLLGAYSDYSSGASGGSVDSILSLLSGMTSGSGTSAAGGLGTLAMNFLSGRSMSDQKTARYLSANYFDASALVWTTNAKGQKVINLSDAQWDLIESVDLNVFVDDGEGYIDLGVDNTYEMDEDGSLIGDYDGTWLAINGQVVAYYRTDAYRDGDRYVINGYVPAFLNGQRVELLLVFDSDHPYGYISGAKPVYTGGETETSAKSLFGLRTGDKLDFICDYYSYDGDYMDSYYLGEQMTVGDQLTISNVSIGSRPIKVTYRFTDMYQQEYWTPVLE